MLQIIALFPIRINLNSQIKTAKAFSITRKYKSYKKLTLLFSNLLGIKLLNISIQFKEAHRVNF
jgi:hypothetical protein